MPLVEVLVFVGLLFVVYGSGQLLSENKSMRLNTMKALVLIGSLTLMVALYLGVAPRLYAQDDASTSGSGRLYVNFSVTSVTIADGWLQVGMGNATWDTKQAQCKSSRIAMLDNDKYASSYFLLAQQALINEKRLRVGVSGRCVTKNDWHQIETLILVSN